MCKLYAVVEIENQKNAERFTKTAIPEITRTDNHGLGIMRLGENGVHIQRWLEPPTVVRRKKSVKLEAYKLALKHQQNEAGTPSRRLDAIAVHGRFATCAKSLQNTHPFYKQGAALMHNGIISNAADFKRELSTCDSEALLSQYVDRGVRDNAEKLDEAMAGVGGYYASVVFNDNGIIDIWRDDTATLHLAHVRNVGIVIATTAEIITKTAKKCEAYITGIDEILPFTHLRWKGGVYPQIREFFAAKPYTPIETTPKSVLGVIEAHQNSVTERTDEPWWVTEEREEREAARAAFGMTAKEEFDMEAERVRKWKAKKQREDIEMAQLYDQTYQRTGI